MDPPGVLRGVEAPSAVLCCGASRLLGNRQAEHDESGLVQEGSHITRVDWYEGVATLLVWFEGAASVWQERSTSFRPGC